MTDLNFLFESELKSYPKAAENYKKLELIETKEFDFDFRLRPAEELPQIVDEIDGVGELVFDLQVFAYPECLNPVP